MLANGYIDMRVQKAFLSGVPGCIEHTARLEEALRHARDTRRSICVSFIDLENAYGSVKHNMFQFALHWYHVPLRIRALIYDYYERQVAQVWTREWTTGWFQMCKGALQGCCSSTSMFIIGFNLVLDGLNAPQYLSLGYHIAPDADPLLKTVFADDVSIVTATPEDNQIVINRFQELLGWTGSMRLKPAKCRSLAMRLFIPGRVSKYRAAQPLQYSSYDPLLTANGTAIKFIGDDKEPFKFLGMLIATDLSNNVARTRLELRLEALLTVIDEQPLRGWMKLWLYNAYVAAKLSWLLLIYDLPLTLIEQTETTCNRYLKKWLGIPSTANPDVLYVTREHHGFQLQNMVTFFKRLQLVRLHLLKTSADPQVRLLYNRLREKVRDRRRKFDPVETLELREATVLNQLALNEQIRHRSGVGSNPKRDQNAQADKPAAVRRQIVELESKASNETRLAHLRTLEMQGLWSRWDNVMQQDLKWRSMFAGAISDAVLRFVVNSQLLTLPSEDNKRRWGIQSSHFRCELIRANTEQSTADTCGQMYPTALHVLTSCPAALKQGRYTWRHNSVLLVLKQRLLPHIRRINEGRHRFPKTRELVWKREDGTWYRPDQAKIVRAPQRLDEYLARATDWEILFDLPSNDKHAYSVFPPEIASTGKRPDILLMSRINKWALALELTCPAEERVADAHKRKTEKYAHLTDDALANGWHFSTWPFEVGCRGFVAISTIKVLRSFHFSRSEQREIKRELEDVTRRCSYYLFCCRHRSTWDERPLLVPSSGPFKSTEGLDA